MKKILVTCRYIFPYLKKIKKKNKNFKFFFYGATQYLSEKNLIKKLKTFDGLICGDDEVTKKVLDSCKKLKVISKWGTGLDSIDLDYAKKKKINIFNTPNAFTYGVAQLAIGMAICHSRKIIDTHHNILSNKWPKLEGQNLMNLKIGIIGYGNIGKAIFKYIKSFSENIKINDIKKKIVPKKNYSTKNNIIKESNLIFLATDLNRTSFHLISKKELQKMRNNIILINVARGPLIDEKYIFDYAYKKNMKLGLDVFENEPLTTNSKFKKMKNCILSSHNAFNTNEDVLKTNINTYKNLLKGFDI